MRGWQEGNREGRTSGKVAPFLPTPRIEGSQGDLDKEGQEECGWFPIWKFDDTKKDLGKNLFFRLAFRACFALDFQSALTLLPLPLN